MQDFSLEIDAITLSEATCLALDKTQKTHNETDILRFAFVRRSTEKPLPVYAVSHDFVMTQAVDYDPIHHDSMKDYRPLSDHERISAYRSFARGELYQLHPAFIERLAIVGSMKITDCRIHTITVAQSKVKIPGWKRTQDVDQKKRYWNKTFDSFITPTDDIRTIAFPDLRVDRGDLLSYLSAKNATITLVDLQPKLIELNEKSPSSWVLRVQTEAHARMIRLRAAGANPTINSIVGDLARWCVENGVRTKTGAHPAAETIRKHALRTWTRPTEG